MTTTSTIGKSIKLALLHRRSRLDLRPFRRFVNHGTRRLRVAANQDAREECSQDHVSGPYASMSDVVRYCAPWWLSGWLSAACPSTGLRRSLWVLTHRMDRPAEGSDWGC